MAGIGGNDPRARSPKLQFLAMANLTLVLHQLNQERSRLASRLNNVSKALAAFGGSRGSTRTRRKLSGAAIARIRAAQKARWQKWRAKKKR
jgi:hypothetical protein